jgi:hypothetical protein
MHPPPRAVGTALAAVLRPPLMSPLSARVDILAPEAAVPRATAKCACAMALEVAQNSVCTPQRGSRSGFDCHSPDDGMCGEERVCAAIVGLCVCVA